MNRLLRHVAPESVITGWDFSTSAVKCLAFDLQGKTLAEVRLPTDLWTESGVSELNLMQLEGQVYASVRAMAEKLSEIGRLDDWCAGGISATHHTAGRLDAEHVQVRRAICWNDQSLAEFHEQGLERLGGQERVRELIGGPWASRYSLSHLVKDESTLSSFQWEQTHRVLSHGSLAAGFLTGNFDVASVSSAASTGIMCLRKRRWCREMLDAIAKPDYRDLVWRHLPRIVDQYDPVGPITERLADEAGIRRDRRPIIFPTSDDQQAGLVGGGAVDSGQLAVILGSSAVVNSASNTIPDQSDLDVMSLNWGPYLLMRCYNNGAQFVDHVVGKSPDWEQLESQGYDAQPLSEEPLLLPFVFPEPSLGIAQPDFRWLANEPELPGHRFRAALESLGYLIALAVNEHQQAGQKIDEITLSGGIARSNLMCEILATILDRPLSRLRSTEGPALGVAVTALSALETHRRHQHDEHDPFTVTDAVRVLVDFSDPVQPNLSWRAAYQRGLNAFQQRIQ